MRSMKNVAAMMAAISAQDAVAGADWGPIERRQPMPKKPKNRDKVKAARKQRRKSR